MKHITVPLQEYSKTMKNCQGTVCLFLEFLSRNLGSGGGYVQFVHIFIILNVIFVFFFALSQGPTCSMQGSHEPMTMKRFFRVACFFFQLLMARLTVSFPTCIS